MKKHKNALLSAALGAALLLPLILAAPACSGGGESGHDETTHHDDGGHEDRDEEEDGHGRELVELTPAQLQTAGITVARAAGGAVFQQLTLPAVVVANADTVTHINPKAPGIVRSIHKHLGDHVEQGDLLGVIDSIELGRAVSGFVRAQALVQAAETTLQREGQLFSGRIETTERVLDGAIEVNRRIYEREQELQEQAVSTIRPLLDADKSLKNSELDKDRQLTDLRAERDARLLALEVELTERRIDRDASHSALLSLGVSAGQLEQLTPDSPLLAGAYEIRAPRAGIVSGRHITTGEYVDSGTKLYTLEDLSSVWILASAYEEQIQSVRTGQTGLIHLDAFPGRTFEGKVSLVGYQVDAESRALGVRLRWQNEAIPDWPEEYPLRPGMFGHVELIIGETAARVVLPESAIVHEDDGTFVFVVSAPGTFQRRAVELGPPSGDTVEIRAGVEPGEEVAVSGTFQLKSVLRQSELGEGHSH